MNDWVKNFRWRWLPDRVTKRSYPQHGTVSVMEGRLTGSTSTDYFHFNCPDCG